MAIVARIERLTYEYPGEAAALVGVSLEIGHGLTVVAGPSGGGKSSLLRVFNGLVPHFHGGRGSRGAGGARPNNPPPPPRRPARPPRRGFPAAGLRDRYPAGERASTLARPNRRGPWGGGGAGILDASATAREEGRGGDLRGRGGRGIRRAAAAGAGRSGGSKR